MNTNLLVVLASIVFFGSMAHGGSDEQEFLNTQSFMTLQDAKIRWGDKKKFDPAEFKVGTPSARSKMAVNLIQTEKMIGKTPGEIRGFLGPFSGFFWSDYIPSYVLEEGWAIGKDTWQLVFLLNDSGKVKTVRIHKNCCAKK